MKTIFFDMNDVLVDLTKKTEKTISSCDDKKLNINYKNIEFNYARCLRNLRMLR